MPVAQLGLGMHEGGGGLFRDGQQLGVGSVGVSQALDQDAQLVPVMVRGVQCRLQAAQLFL
ncbi:hypothetical protein D3C85_655470 [compost metagenome]